MELLLQQIVNGLTVGAVYDLIARSTLEQLWQNNGRLEANAAPGLPLR
jgi:hypothetical protein